jgi:GNAT superfamily N-acetyltransferase
VLRPARPDEGVALADLWLRSRHASVPANPPPVHDDNDVRRWFAAVVMPTREVWVGEVEGTVVALMVMEDHWIDQLHVDPDYTSQGWGSQLVALAKQLRPGGLELWTFQSNIGARRFYERHGFEAVEMTDGANEEAAPDVRYRWSAKLVP